MSYRTMDLKANITVNTGEVWVTGRRIVLKSDAIGSCGALLAYEKKKGIGGLAHIMLPGKSRNSKLSQNTRYAVDAIDDLLFKMTRLGAVRENIKACLVGGGNVLNDKNDKICAAIISSITELLLEKEIEIVKKAVGGIKRRGVSLDIEDGKAYYFEGDADIKLLYNWRKAGDEQ